MSIKKTIRNAIKTLPGCKALIRTRNNYLANSSMSKLGGREGIFNHWYKTNKWGDEESVSGPGSTLEYTKNIRKEMPKLALELGASVILDAPCGDYNWFGKIEWESDVSYIGGDIVEALVERNQSLYSSDSVKFMNLDVMKDTLPQVDLWLCRDCLFHFSNEDVLLTLNNLLSSKVKYILTTTYPHIMKNHDIHTGMFRAINLQKSPFNLGEPIQEINDWIDGYESRVLGLWSVEDLRKTLAENRAIKRIQKTART